MSRKPANSYSPLQRLFLDAEGFLIIIEKVVAYITQGSRFLVFSHPHHPEAGIQVPSGTIKLGETPEEAVLREAWEETELTDLEIRSFLGTQVFDMSSFGRSEVQRRYFFHLEFHGETSTTWRYFENDPSDGSQGPIEFEFFWVKLPDEVPDLMGGQDAFLRGVTTQPGIK
ncbi:MAG: NUDIX domain-containing protein [Anaerolineales bacterium]|nr:NUDIX domain-containing protein [Anaerolineales bacterium]